MSRSVVIVDRLATLLVALLLIATGAAAIVWWLGELGLMGPVDVALVVEQTTQAWWSWAAGLVGVVLVLLGLRWLLGHIPHRGVAAIRLRGTGTSGRLTAQVSQASHAAAELLEETEGVRSTRGTIHRDRGQLVARIKATVEPQADLAAVTAAADTVATELKQVLDRDDLRCSVRLHVARRGRRLSRVD